MLPVYFDHWPNASKVDLLAIGSPGGGGGGIVGLVGNIDYCPPFHHSCYKLELIDL